jgi:Ca-activated chloride channel homolog
VFTDGEDVASRSTMPSVRTALQTADVVLYVIGEGKAAEDLRLRGGLTTLAAETGGLAFFPRNMRGLTEQFARIVADLSTEYVVGYSPERPIGDGTWRRLRVEVGGRDDRYRVRFREGYLAVSHGSK